MATTAAPAAQRIVLSNISWKTYEGLVADNIDQSAPRLAYDRGTLEIKSPGPDHEEVNRTLARLVWLVAVETGVPIRDVGSMTYKRATMQRGAEPDSSFYLNRSDIADPGWEIDPDTVPPPDLVIEIDASRSSLAKLDLYRQFGVQEVWIWEIGRTRFFILERDRFEESDRSRVFPVFSTEIVTDFVQQSRSLSSDEWYRAVVDWARSV